MGLGWGGRETCLPAPPTATRAPVLCHRRGSSQPCPGDSLCFRAVFVSTSQNAPREGCSLTCPQEPGPAGSGSLRTQNLLNPLAPRQAALYPPHLRQGRWDFPLLPEGRGVDAVEDGREGAAREAGGGEGEAHAQGPLCSETSRGEGGERLRPQRGTQAPPRPELPALPRRHPAMRGSV